MNKPLKWGLGFLAGVIVGNLIWAYGLESPAARFFTAGWWQHWTAAYGIALIAILIGIVRLAWSKAAAGPSTPVE